MFEATLPVLIYVFVIGIVVIFVIKSFAYYLIKYLVKGFVISDFRHSILIALITQVISMILGPFVTKLITIDIGLLEVAIYFVLLVLVCSKVLFALSKTNEWLTIKDFKTAILATSIVELINFIWA